MSSPHPRREHPGLVVLTDLDGTLLDFETYQAGPAVEKLRELAGRGIPVIFCSSKTRAEQQWHRTELGVRDPFIVENGAAVFIPRGYFEGWEREAGEFNQIELGRPRREIWRELEQIRSRTGLAFRGFGEMEVEEISSLTGLSPGAARRAREREYSETLHLQLEAREMADLQARLTECGLAGVSGGRLFTVTDARADKGEAARLLLALFRRRQGQVVSVGLGDSPNDLPLLQEVDRAFLVQRPDGSWADVQAANLIRVAAAGPKGWCRAIDSLLRS